MQIMEISLPPSERERAEMQKRISLVVGVVVVGEKGNAHNTQHGG